MDYRKKLQKVRRLEGEMAPASPAKAARLTREIVRLKDAVFRKWQP